MWIHILIFAAWPALRIFQHLGWVKEFPDRKKKWLCGLLLLGGNILGCALTYGNNCHLALEEGSYLPKKEAEEGVYEEVLEVELDQERLTLPIQVPAREPGAKAMEGQEEASEKESLEDLLMAETRRLNEERPSADRYYLPDTLDGKKLAWSRPYDTQGAMLATLCLAAALGIWTTADKEKQRLLQKRRAQMELDYPGLVMKLSLLLEAGLPTSRAFQRTALDYKKYRLPGKERHAYEEMLAACREMENGVSEGEAYYRFGRRCGQIHYKTLATLLVQNVKKGSQGLLQALEREAQQAWEDRKRRARIAGETAATRLLVPMVLMLVVVLAIVMIPAFFAFYS